jgi:hypothetical protein
VQMRPRPASRWLVSMTARVTTKNERFAVNCRENTVLKGGWSNGS